MTSTNQSIYSNKANTQGYISYSQLKIDKESIKQLRKHYIAFDVETTGLSPVNDKIVEVGAVLFENGKIIQRYSTLINPEISIPVRVSAINHITDDMVKDAPKEDVVCKELVEFLGEALNKQIAICAHNAIFDMNFLSRMLARLGYHGKISYVDTLSLARSTIRGLYNYKQDTVAQHFNLVNNQSHRAVTDAEVCGKILWNILNIMDK